MFEETHEFDSYLAEYNKLPATDKVRQLGYERIGFTNTDDGRHYTVHLQDGKIVKVVVGLDNPNFTASGSLQKVRTMVMARQYADLRSEISVPMSVKLRLVKLLWS
jgi:hypothetical protein